MESGIKNLDVMLSGLLKFKKQIFYMGHNPADDRLVRIRAYNEYIQTNPSSIPELVPPTPYPHGILLLSPSNGTSSAQCFVGLKSGYLTFG